MPLSRYQIRNEYGLGDQQLYKVADKDDAEALLEGVAMTGLVGLLRQLGDLAELVSLSSSLSDVELSEFDILWVLMMLIFLFIIWCDPLALEIFLFSFLK